MEEGEEGALIAIDVRFGIAAGSLAAAYANDDFRKRLDEEMPVTRAWGIPGLMLALFIERLSSSQSFLACENCGRAISGRSHKRFCSEEDDPACYRARRAGSKRGERKRGRVRS